MGTAPLTLLSKITIIFWGYFLLHYYILEEVDKSWYLSQINTTTSALTTVNDNPSTFTVVVNDSLLNNDTMFSNKTGQGILLNIDQKSQTDIVFHSQFCHWFLYWYPKTSYYPNIATLIHPKSYFPLLEFLVWFNLKLKSVQFLIVTRHMSCLHFPPKGCQLAGIKRSFPVVVFSPPSLERRRKSRIKTTTMIKTCKNMRIKLKFMKCIDDNGSLSSLF